MSGHVRTPQGPQIHGVTVDPRGLKC